MPSNLVTGASGFLGSHLVENLVAQGKKVRCLVRPSSKTAYLESLGAEIVYGDLNDVESLKVASQDVDHVYHCAAFVADWGTWETFRTANIIGTQNILDAALNSGVNKFIYVSSADVYGHPNHPSDETAPYRMRGWQYGDTKVEAEQLVWSYYHQHKLPITVVRPSNIYGPRSTTFVLEIIDLLKKGSMVHIKGNKPAGLTYVTNVVDILIRAANSTNSTGQAYNASDNLDTTWRQYVDRLAEIISVPSPTIVIPYRLAYLTGWMMEIIYAALRVKTRPLLTRNAVEIFGTHQGLSINKACQELGYEPRINFDEGMRQVELWLHQIGEI